MQIHTKTVVLVVIAFTLLVLFVRMRSAFGW